MASRETGSGYAIASPIAFVYFAFFFTLPFQGDVGIPYWGNAFPKTEIGHRNLRLVNTLAKRSSSLYNIQH